MKYGISYEEMCILLRLKEKFYQAIKRSYPGIEDVKSDSDNSDNTDNNNMISE